MEEVTWEVVAEEEEVAEEVVGGEQTFPLNFPFENAKIYQSVCLRIILEHFKASACKLPLCIYARYFA